MRDDLTRWTGPINPGPFSFRPGRPPRVDITVRFVDPDGTYTGGVYRIPEGRHDFDPELAGTWCPGTNGHRRHQEDQEAIAVQPGPSEPLVE